METGRIWLYFTPILALAAACGDFKRMRTESIAWALSYALVFELAFRHYR